LNVDSGFKEKSTFYSPPSTFRCNIDTKISLSKQELFIFLPLNSPQVKILPQERAPLLSQIFKWYQYDFEGGASALIDMFLNYLDEGENKDF
jgi:hypothetical protein